MDMSISLTFNDGSYQSLNVIKKIINFVMYRISSVSEDTNLLLRIKSETKCLLVVNLYSNSKDYPR